VNKTAASAAQLAHNC